MTRKTKKLQTPEFQYRYSMGKVKKYPSF